MQSAGNRVRQSAQKRGPRCIYCGNAKEGLPIREDAVLASIRWFNRKILKRYRNYRLVVCKECYIDYKKARAKYVRKQVTYLAIGFIFAALLIVLSGANPFAFLYGFVIIVFMYLLSVISYVPALAADAGERHTSVTTKNRAKNM